MLERSVLYWKDKGINQALHYTETINGFCFFFICRYFPQLLRWMDTGVSMREKQGPFNKTEIHWNTVSTIHMLTITTFFTGFYCFLSAAAFSWLVPVCHQPNCFVLELHGCPLYDNTTVCKKLTCASKHIHSSWLLLKFKIKYEVFIPLVPSVYLKLS